MADEGKTKTEAQEAQEAGQYPRERLIADANQFFGHPPHVVAGALHGSKKNLTLDETRKAIDKFLGRELDED